MIFDWFNIDFAWEKLKNYLQHFEIKDQSNMIQIIIAIFIIFIVWKFIKNIVFAVLFAVLSFIVYQSYFNVPSESETIGSKDTQVDIKTNNENVVSKDVKKLINDLISKNKED